MSGILKAILELLKHLAPQIIGALLDSSSPAGAIDRANEKTKSTVEWIEEVKTNTAATGEGGHPLDRLLDSAIKSEETVAKTKRGVRGAVNVTLGVAKKLIF